MDSNMTAAVVGAAGLAVGLGITTLCGSSKAPEANPPALVQLQVDPERTGALRLYQSRGFEEVPAHVCCACMPR